MRNRSVPTDTVLPNITYRNLSAAVLWFTATFGFVEHYRYGDENGQPSGVQMHLDRAWIMLNSTRTERSSPAQNQSRVPLFTVFVYDVDTHFARTTAAGAASKENLLVARALVPYNLMSGKLVRRGLRPNFGYFAPPHRDASTQAPGA